jgi:alpha/beta superfamily hydrolase
MKLIYRISDTGYSKVKPSYISNEACLKNAMETFPWREHNWSIIADNISEETNNMIQKYIPRSYIDYVSVGHGAGTFNLALDEALTYDDDETVYFLENDYLHKPNSDKILLEGFSLGASFVSLYDHPDKYMSPSLGGNPYCEGGAEDTRVYLTKSCHWKITNSTTMTFAAKVETLKRIETVLRKHTLGAHPNDFEMFLELRKQNELLITPLPGYSTHGETAWLTPTIDWSSL